MRLLKIFSVLLLMSSTASIAKEAAFKVNGKTTFVKDLHNEDAAAFFKVEKQRFELIAQLAEKKFLEDFWAKLAKKEGKSVEAARKAYFDKNIKVSSKELKETLDKFKDHPQLKKLSKAEQKKEITNYLTERNKRSILDGIIGTAKAKKNLVIIYPRPKEPTYKLIVEKTDNIRFGPVDSDIKPVGCNNDCAITVIEYSEFQCPFCSRVLPSVKRLLTEYKGKVRWIVRDFPLSFHDRAKPAAIAAHCAAKQGKYWYMYTKLFDNQRSLSDGDFEKYAGAIKGLNSKKWKKCVKSPGKINALIEKNIAEGAKLGVSGTPAFFINGRRLSGALPYDEFKRIFEEELSSKNKS